MFRSFLTERFVRKVVQSLYFYAETSSVKKSSLEKSLLYASNVIFLKGLTRANLTNSVQKFKNDEKNFELEKPKLLDGFFLKETLKFECLKLKKTKIY